MDYEGVPAHLLSGPKQPQAKKLPSRILLLMMGPLKFGSSHLALIHRAFKIWVGGLATSQPEISRRLWEVRF